MPSTSAAQHRYFGWLHSHPEERPASLSKSQVDEWLHSDRGSPWQHKAPGGGLSDYLGLGNAGVQMMSGAANGIGTAGAAGQTTIPTPDPVAGGQAPSVTTQNPLYQANYQRFANLPVEKLQELAMQLPGNSAQGQMVRRALQMAHMRQVQPSQQKPQQQSQDQQPASSAADDQGIGSGPGYADGGMTGVPLGEADPWWTRAAARQDMSTGYLHGGTFGRADHLTTAAPGGSYVVPADVTSGLGEGNSMAGANVIQRTLETGPYGTPLPRGGRGHSIPRAPTPRFSGGYAGGGETRGGHVGYDGVGRPVPVKFSHGEFVMTPGQVMRIGRRHFGYALSPDEVMKKTHEMLDAWVVHKRKEIARAMMKLPGPTK